MLTDVLDGSAPVTGNFTLIEAHLLAALAYRQRVRLQAARTGAGSGVSRR
jgi:hypothetical protein